MFGEENKDSNHVSLVHISQGLVCCYAASSLLIVAGCWCSSIGETLVMRSRVQCSELGMLPVQVLRVCRHPEANKLSFLVTTLGQGSPQIGILLASPKTRNYQSGI